MPLATNPNKKFKLVLDSDKDRDPAPCFIYPYLSGIQQEALIETFDAINDASDQSANFKHAFEAATRHLVGWEHITDTDGNDVPFDAARFKEFVSLMEAMEIINKLLMQQNLDVTDKKK